MKISIWRYLFVLLAVFTTHLYTQSKLYPHLIQYLHPVPSAQYIPPSTNIIVRLTEPIDKKSISSNSLTVVGSKSGSHSVGMIVSDDDRTAIFQPTVPFLWNETVTITINNGIKVFSGSTVGAYEYNFSVSSQPPSNLNIKSSYDLELEEISKAVHKQPQGSGNELPSTNLKTTGGLPADFPVLTVTHSDNPTPGYIFLSNVTFSFSSVSNTPYLMILDNFCNPVYYQKMSGICFDFKPQPNGTLTYWNSSMFEAMDSTHTVNDSYACGNGYSTDPHDLRILPNGHAVLLGLDVQVMDMTPIDSAGHTNAQVIGLIIQELDLHKNVVFEWRSWDHFKITDATHIDFGGTTIDYVHGNALEIDTDGNIILSSRHMDEITKIDRQTGDIIWRFGGKNNQFTFLNDTVHFSHQHAVRRIKNGNITMFDNGNFHVPAFSRAVEYTVDEKNKTATLVWQYRNSPDYFGNALGYVQRLDNGNTLISWGATSPAVTEVKPDGSKAFEMTLPDGVFSYRASRSELPFVTKVENNVAAPVQFALNQNYPNPFNPTTTISYALPKDGLVTLKVYDMLGKEVATLVNNFKQSGHYSEEFDASTLSSGVYIYKLSSNAVTEVKKMVLIK